MRIKKAYKLITTSMVVSIMVAMCLVAPLSAQSDSTMDQSQSASTSSSPCITPGQSAGQTMSQSSEISTTQSMSETTAPMIGTGTDNAGAPLDCMLALDAHKSNWYKFRYGYNSDQDDSPNPATVKLSMDTPGCIGFEVWTQDQLNKAQNASSDDDKVGPVGSGTPEYAAIERDSSSSKNQNPSKLIWVGSQEGSATFYVVVKNHKDVACSYQLSISGFSVSFPSNAK